MSNAWAHLAQLTAHRAHLCSTMPSVPWRPRVSQNIIEPHKRGAVALRLLPGELHRQGHLHGWHAKGLGGCPHLRQSPASFGQAMVCRG